MTDRDALLTEITTKAIVHGKVTLSSGREADYYVDLRRVTLDAVARLLSGQSCSSSPRTSTSTRSAA